MTPAGSTVRTGLEARRDREEPVAVVIVPEGSAALVTTSDRWTIAAAEVGPLLREVDEALSPRWLCWDGDTPRRAIAAGARLTRCWHLAAVHRLLFGGWRAEPARVWAAVHGLDLHTIPGALPNDLFSSLVVEDDPVDPNGHLAASWQQVGDEWGVLHAMRYAELALEVEQLQRRLLDHTQTPVRARATARSESTAELLCAELSADGLPLDRRVAEQLLTDVVGPRPRDAAHATSGRAERDATVLCHATAAFDLRNPAQVKSMFRSVGIELADTRAWRLESLVGQHPIVEAFLSWRKAERIATTFGYGWLDEHVDADGRLRGEWSACDGAAGRMTATAGLHNMPLQMRPAVVAEPGHLFVRADLGQIEPRVLAAVSGDPLLADATRQPDLYQPVATQLGVDRSTAKVAVLGAMYGQTTGHGAQALRRLQQVAPVAMRYLDDADQQARSGADLFTFGGRRIRMSSSAAAGIEHDSERDQRSSDAARGRYGRNAMIQGAAAELFKMWALTVRARAAAHGARIVLCLHDELLVHLPSTAADDVAVLMSTCLDEAAHRWHPTSSVRFVADVSVIARWSDAKA